MNNFKTYILMATGFAVLAAVVSGIAAGPAIAQIVKSALVKNVDEPGRSPYSASASCSAADGCDMSFARVPANKRLVVQFVSANVSASNVNGDIPSLVLLSGKIHAYLPTTRVTKGFSNTGQAVTAYIDGNEVPILNATLLGAAVQANGILTGYLVDLTQ